MDISKFKYPMLAITECKGPGVKCPAGEKFDALTIANVNAFKQLKSAQMLQKPVTTGATSAPAAAVDQAKASSEGAAQTATKGATEPEGQGHDRSASSTPGKTGSRK